MTIAAPDAPTTAPAVTTSAPSVARSLAPFAVDVALPVAAYLAARELVGMSVVGAFVVSSVVPVLRSIGEFARHRAANTLALVVLATSLAGIVATFVTGDVRIATAKSAAVSGVVALGFVVSALRGRPALAPGLRAYVAHGDPAREAAWDRLQSGSTRFRALQNRFTLIFGVALLVECAGRLVASMLAPVSTLGWLPTVLLVAGIVAAMIVSGGAAADPIRELLDAEVADDRA